ncbi:uncharacterized protein LOC129237311 [Anastrepha obliqua]|uniref:uncharacterized protein LOC128858934 n=1 Tax=Anastrepha ludens TaxID=28586 RepID=UPI0023B0F970|nr:uncharacterized protein LOC128858934 [Anastrepha ludens]XP_054727949.1 uncharacterized protein LOC129237311 [Anastrepha obliqua]
MSTNSSRMSENSSNMSLEDWTDHINTRLDVIYKDLCDFEQSINAQNETGDTEEVKLMELLEAVNDIRRTARSIRPKTNILVDKQAQLREQMEMLQRSVEILHLENRTRAVEIEPLADEAME